MIERLKQFFAPTEETPKKPGKFLKTRAVMPISPESP
jgi:hypothetical protein